MSKSKTVLAKPKTCVLNTVQRVLELYFGTPVVFEEITVRTIDRPSPTIVTLRFTINYRIIDNGGFEYVRFARGAVTLNKGENRWTPANERTELEISARNANWHPIFFLRLPRQDIYPDCFHVDGKHEVYRGTDFHHRTIE